jgi:uncharacterized protein YkwD
VYPNSAGYRPARLAVAGIIGAVAGLVLPALDLDPQAGALLGSAGAWLVLAAYLLYAVNIYDLRTAGARAAAVLMLAVPLAVSWDGGRFPRALAEDPTAAAVSLAVVLVLGSFAALALLWALGTVRRGALSLVHRPERRRQGPSPAWAVAAVLAVSACSFASTGALPADPAPSELVRDAAGAFRDAGPAPAPEVSIPPASTGTPIAGRAAAADPAAVEQAVFSLTNRERERQGLPALEWDAALAAVARAHSRDMAENAFFAHANPRGQDPTARAAAAGYPVRRDLGGMRYSLGIAENIGMMPTGNVVGRGHVDDEPQSIAGAMVRAWMDSPGHRENILHGRYARIGVGVAYDGSLSYLGTQDFI